MRVSVSTHAAVETWNVYILLMHISMCMLDYMCAHAHICVLCVHAATCVCKLNMCAHGLKCASLCACWVMHVPVHTFMLCVHSVCLHSECI